MTTTDTSSSSPAPAPAAAAGLAGLAAPVAPTNNQDAENDKLRSTNAQMAATLGDHPELKLVMALLSVMMGGDPSAILGGNGASGPGQGRSGSSAGGGSGGGLGSGSPGVCGGHVDAVAMADGEHSASELIVAQAKLALQMGNSLNPDSLRAATGNAGSNDAWCASAYSYNAERAGLRGIGTASALGIGEQFRAHGAFHEKFEHIAAGDALVFGRDGEASHKGHVATVVSVTHENGRTMVHTIEGNVGGGKGHVDERTYTMDELNGHQTLRHGESAGLRPIGYGSVDEMVAAIPENKRRFKPRDADAPKIAAADTPNVPRREPVAQRG